MKLVAFHLLNDYSGSPKALRAVITGLRKRGVDVLLHTSRGGVLDTLDIPVRHFCYRFGGAATLPLFLWAQLRMFAASWRYIFVRPVFYVNTVLPVGAALAGRLSGQRVVYHYHEAVTAKGMAYRILGKAMEWLASDIICVSEYQRALLSRHRRVHVVPNAIPEEMRRRLKPDPEAAFGRKKVLMLSSLKTYKGTGEFLELARRMPQFRFELVINDSPAHIGDFISAQTEVLPANLNIYLRQKDVCRFYNNASVVVNLTDRHRFIETFGLTALEGMGAGLPAVVPTVGGIADLVEDGVNGYRIDVENLSDIERAIGRLLTNKALYMRLSRGALSTAGRYRQEMTDKVIYSILRNAL